MLASMLDQASRPPFTLDPLIAEAKRRTRRRRLAIVLALMAAAGIGGAFVLRLTVPLTAPAAARGDCRSGVSGQGFRVFACMSGGALAGHPHPKELLVVRNNGSSVAFPAYGGFGFAVGDGEVVAVHDYSLVRVTSRRIVPLVSRDELASALHRQPKTILIMGFGHLRVDAHGDIYFFASTLIHSRHECENRLLERTPGARIRQLRTLPNNTCN